MTKQINLIPSKQPEKDILLVAPKDQQPHLRQYYPGYERTMANMTQIPIPEHETDQEMIDATDNISIEMQNLANQIKMNTDFDDDFPTEFDRFILAIEKPITGVISNGEHLIKAGSEIVLARWNTNHTSPIHGHASGYIHEQVISGKIRVNTYKRVKGTRNLARPLKTEIITPGLFLSKYNHPIDDIHPRPHVVHNFIALEPTITLHFLAEHTRDGRDNGFNVEYFETHFGLNKNDVDRITTKDGMYLQKGEVVLVRSSNVPEYGDHFIIVTGSPVMKEHGFRVQDEAIQAPFAYNLLKEFDPYYGVILLKLKPEVAKQFLKFHSIEIKNGNVIFPEA